MPLLLAVLLLGAILLVLCKLHGPGYARIFAPGETYILVENGILRLRQGWIPARDLAMLADLLRDAGVSSGSITLAPDRRVAVSWHVPPALHQRIRNILLNSA